MALSGMRHLALKVSDPQSSKRFYCECFGMRVVWEPDPDNVYLSSGVDNLALHRAQADPARGSLDHLGFVAETRADVDRLAAELRARGVPVAAAPRDHRDGSRSFYCLDPDGTRVQVLFEPTLSCQRLQTS
jgi:catechol 2,3-dioxygenase-like lactoylglutathione lyase family enzyme